MPAGTPRHTRVPASALSLFSPSTCAGASPPLATGPRWRLALCPILTVKSSALLPRVDGLVLRPGAGVLLSERRPFGIFPRTSRPRSCLAPVRFPVFSRHIPWAFRARSLGCLLVGALVPPLFSPPLSLGLGLRLRASRPPDPPRCCPACFSLPLRAGLYLLYLVVATIFPGLRPFCSPAHLAATHALAGTSPLRRLIGPAEYVGPATPARRLERLPSRPGSARWRRRPLMVPRCAPAVPWVGMHASHCGGLRALWLGAGTSNAGAAAPPRLRCGRCLAELAHALPFAGPALLSLGTADAHGF